MAAGSDNSEAETASAAHHISMVGRQAGRRRGNEEEVIFYLKGPSVENPTAQLLILAACRLTIGRLVHLKAL